MTVNQIKEILKGKFENESDRLYWIEKLEILEAKEATAKNNEKYFEENIVYNR